MTNSDLFIENESTLKLPLISDVLPHKAPMILIDKMIAVAEETVHCQLTITPNHTYYDQAISGLAGWIGIELMAQTVASWSGFHALQKKCNPPMGFLLGTRRYKSNVSTFANLSVLHIYAERLMENDGMAVFSCKIESQGNILAIGQLNAYVPSKEKLDQIQSTQ